MKYDTYMYEPSDNMETIEGGILFVLSLIGVIYYIVNYKPTWELGILILVCFFLPALCDGLGMLIHDGLLYIKNKINLQIR